MVPPRQANPVKLTPTKRPKLAPWNVKPESNKTAKVTRKENARKGARPHQRKKKAPHVEGFNMKNYINDIVAEEKKTRKSLEAEKEESLAPAKTETEEKENEGADEGMEEMKEQIRGEEIRTIRERKRLLEESWKRDNQRKTAQSIRVQERSEIVGERHMLKETGGVVGPLPDEATVVGKGEWAKKNKDEKASELRPIVLGVQGAIIVLRAQTVRTLNRRLNARVAPNVRIALIALIACAVRTA